MKLRMHDSFVLHSANISPIMRRRTIVLFFHSCTLSRLTHYEYMVNALSVSLCGTLYIHIAHERKRVHNPFNFACVAGERKKVKSPYVVRKVQRVNQCTCVRHSNHICKVLQLFAYTDILRRELLL